MIKRVQLDDKPTKLKIVIQTFSKEKLWIKVSDADRKNTYYTKRYAFVEGKETFFVYMPQAPEDAIVKVYNIVNIMFLRLFVIALDSEGSRKVYVSFVFKEALDSEGLRKPLGSNF